MIITDKYIKLGTMPTEQLMFRYNYKIEVGKRVQFRINRSGYKYQTGIIKQINDVCIFIELC